VSAADTPHLAASSRTLAEEVVDRHPAGSSIDFQPSSGDGAEFWAR
jgi:hypothetical protein